MRDLLHKFRFFAFVPWLAFWGQAGPSVLDQSRLRVAIGPLKAACKEVTKTFNVKVARSPESRSRGLSGRATPLAPDEGMLFIFERPEHAAFWMKETLIPLEIAFFDGAGLLTETRKMAVESDPARPRAQYHSKDPVVAALEVAPGALLGSPARRSVLCVDTLVRP